VVIRSICSPSLIYCLVFGVVGADIYRVTAIGYSHPGSYSSGSGSPCRIWGAWSFARTDVDIFCHRALAFLRKPLLHCFDTSFGFGRHRNGSNARFAFERKQRNEQLVLASNQFCFGVIACVPNCSARSISFSASIIADASRSISRSIRM
jgi:hypothetical protein